MVTNVIDTYDDTIFKTNEGNVSAISFNAIIGKLLKCI